MIHARLLKPSSLLILAALITSCQTPKPIPTPHPLSSEQKICVTRCNQQNALCSHKYGQLYRQCVEQAHQQATLNYKAYFDDQMAHHKKPKDLKKTYNDFFKTEHCQQQLDCKADQRACYTNCDLSQ